MKKKHLIVFAIFLFVLLIGKQIYAEDFKINISTTDVQVEPGKEVEIQVSVEDLIRKSK